MERISVRHLRENLSSYLKQVEEGKSITITRHGRVIGKLIPEGRSREDRLENLVQSGLVKWNGEQLADRDPVARNTGNNQVSDLVSVDRDVDYLP